MFSLFKNKEIYVSLFIDESADLWFMVLDKKNIQHLPYCINTVPEKLSISQFKKKLSNGSLPADWNKFLIIINFHLHILRQGIPDLLKQNLDILKLFRYHIWLNQWEGPQKLPNNLPLASNVAPVFENLNEYQKLVQCEYIAYIDSDLQTASDFKKWKILKPSKLELIIEHSGSLWANTVVNNFLEAVRLPDIYGWVDYRRQLSFDYSDSNIFWCYNRTFREGKTYIVYNLRKENLTSYGKISYYGNKNITNSYKPILAQTFYDYGYINDLSDFEKFLNLPDIESDEVNASKNLANILDRKTWSCPINICTETNCFEDNLFFNEKTIKPIMLSQLILPMTSTGLFHALSEKFGFVFSNITLEIDRIENKRIKMEKILYYLKFFISNKNLLEIEINKNLLYFENNMEIINNQSKFFKINNPIDVVVRKLERHCNREFSL